MINNTANVSMTQCACSGSLSDPLKWDHRVTKCYYLYWVLSQLS